MVKNYFISYVEDDTIMHRLMDDIMSHPDVEEARYIPFQQKVKIVYRNGVSPDHVLSDIEDILHSHNSKMTLSEKSGVDTPKANRLNVLLFIIGIVIYALTYFLPFIPDRFEWIGYLIGLILSGIVLLRKVYESIFKKHRLDENILIFVAVVGGFLIGDYIETMLVLILYLAAEYLSWRAYLLVKRDVTDLLQKEQTMAYKLKDNKVVLPVPLKEVEVGDTLLIRPGELIPLGGIIVEGSSTLDVSTISSDEVTRKVEPGMTVESGSLNGERPLHVAVSKTYNEGLVNTLIQKTEEAMEKKSPLAGAIEKIGYWYVIGIAVIAIAVVLLGPLIVGQPMFSEDFIYKGLVILAVSCPWAMLLSTPIAYNYALSVGKRKGILIKEVAGIDTLGKLKSLFFSKTGILTTGDYRVKEIIPYRNTEARDVLFYGAIGESDSIHPIGKAVRDFNKEKINDKDVQVCADVEGKGGRCVTYKGEKKIFVGNENFFYDNGLEPYIEEDGTIVHVSLDGDYLGAIILEESLKEEGTEAMEKLKELKLGKVAVLTGEQHQGARKILAPLKVRNIYGGLDIDEKVEKIHKKQVRLKGKTVGFVGDTIGDGPVMAASDVSFAFLKGGLDKVTDIADVVLLKEDLNLVYESIHLGKKTYSIILENIIFSFVVKAVIIAVAIFVNVQEGYMLTAIGIDLFVSFLTILNCFRITRSIRALFKRKPKEETIEEEVIEE